MKKYITAIAVGAVLMSVGCKSADEKAVDERKEAAKEIGAAATKVVDTQIDAAKDINKQTDPVDREEAKIDATEDLAEANKELQDEKVEATKEISEADAAAGRGGTFKRE